MQQRFAKIVVPLAEAIRKGPLMLLAGSALLGILLADPGGPARGEPMDFAPETGFRLLLVCAVGLVLGALALALAMRSRSRPHVALFTGALLSLVGFGFLHHQRIESIYAFPLARALTETESVEVRGRGWFCERPVAEGRSTSATLHLESLSIGGTEVRCRHRVPVWLAGRAEGYPDDSTADSSPGDRAFRYGDRISFTGRLRPLETARSPGGFDPASFYYRESGSLARLEIGAGDELQQLDGRSGLAIVSLANRFRDTLERGLLVGVDAGDEPYARLIAAMSLGARENSPEDLEDWFRRSGTMHIFAVSGLHVGILAAILLGALLLVGVPRRYAILVLIPLIVFYAVMTGLRPSAIRSAVMLSVFLLGFVAKEDPRPLNQLGLAALLLLLFDTQQLFLPGFQLSFAVLLSITLFAAPLQRRTSGPWLTDPFLPRSLRGPIRRGKDRIVSGLAAAFAVSLVSWLGSLGLLIWHFQSYSPIGIVANLFLVPFVGVIVGLALASLACYGLQLVPLAALLNQVNVTAAVLLTSLAQFFAELPGAHRNAGRGLVAEPAPSSIVLDVMGTRGEGAVLASWPTPVPGGSRERSHRYWMIDCGGMHTYRKEMLPLLRSRSINRLDALVLTHGDIRHIGAAPQVITQLRPGLLVEGTGPNRSPAYPEIESLKRRLEIRDVVVSAGSRLRPRPDTTVRVLAPDPDAQGRIADDRCLVLRIERGDLSVLLTADIGFTLEKNLLESGARLRSDVWIRGEHSETESGLEAFARAVAPRVVISTAADFPAPEQVSPDLVETLEDLGAEFLTLDETGVVTLELEESSLRIHTRAPEPREIVLRTRE